MPKIGPIAVVDAFTDRPFSGNPAAVCLLDPDSLPPPDDWLQRFAAEMNLSETAYLQPAGDRWRLRWFTPTVEADLCGHATLASAHFLWESGAATGSPIAFETRSGLLTATRGHDLIELDFPSTPAEPAERPQGVEEALGTEAVWSGRTRFDLLLELDSEETLCGLRPDFRRLAELDARGVMVTARSREPGIDFVSRFFAPAAGIDEDPVTGSAHCALGPYWRERLGKDRLVGHQASHRGGVVVVTPTGDRVKLAGPAVTVLRAELGAAAFPDLHGEA